MSVNDRLNSFTLHARAILCTNETLIHFQTIWLLIGNDFQNICSFTKVLVDAGMANNFRAWRTLYYLPTFQYPFA